jgi:ribosomal protein S18 acetylase RimI-like enzyme
MPKFILKHLRPCNINNFFIDIIYKHFEYIAEDPYLKHNKTEIERLLSSQQLFGVLMYNEGNIVGYAIGEFMNLNVGRQAYYISYLYVVKQFRGHGLGKSMMDVLIKENIGRGINNVMLTCDTRDTRLLNWYRKMGFRPDKILTSSRVHNVFTLEL